MRIARETLPTRVDARTRTINNPQLFAIVLEIMSPPPEAGCNFQNRARWKTIANGPKRVGTPLNQSRCHVERSETSLVYCRWEDRFKTDPRFSASLRMTLCNVAVRIGRMKKIVSTNEAPGAIGPYSQAVRSGSLL